MRLFFSIVILLSGSLDLFAADEAKSREKPNIVMILADDVGIDGLGCYGSDHFKDKTPNIDRLSREGLRFTHCYSEPSCGPSRCQLMTGRYPFRTGALNNESTPRALPNAEVSIAKTLKQAGYATAAVGKWRQMNATPRDWGFDEYVTDPAYVGWYWQKSYIKNGQTVRFGKEVYVPDVMQEDVLDFIRRHQHKPFFLYYAMHLVHVPIMRTPDSKSGSQAMIGSDAKLAELLGTPNSKAGAEATALYDDNIAYTDKQVGQLVAELDKLNLRRNTIIVFSGDNGTAKPVAIGGRQIKGAKGTMQEGGVRVPLVVSWQGTTPEGKKLDDLVDFSDFLPTFAELAGVKLADAAVRFEELGGARLAEAMTIDGRSFAPQIKGQPGQPRRWVYVQFAARWYVRERDWKLTQAGQLFDMKNAPFEETAVTADSGEAAAARRRLKAVLKTLDPAGGKTDATPVEAAVKTRPVVTPPPAPAGGKTDATPVEGENSSKKPL